MKKRRLAVESELFREGLLGRECNRTRKTKTKAMRVERKNCTMEEIKLKVSIILFTLKWEINMEFVEKLKIETRR